MVTLASVTVLALTSLPSAPSILRRNGYAIPPAVGRVVEVSVLGMIVLGRAGLSEAITFGGDPEVWCSPTGDGNCEAERSGASVVASARPGFGSPI